MKRGFGMVKSNKKSQYYLIAAVIIVTIILGASVVTNYIITKDEPVKFYDLNEELGQETSRVVDYGIYNELDILDLIENFTTEYFVEYAEEKDRDVEFVFIYGSKDNVKIATYFNDTLHIGRPEFGYDYQLFENSDSDWACVDATWDNNIQFSNWNVLLENCVMNGNIELTDGKLRINDSEIYGNIYLKNSELKITNSYISQNTEVIIQKKAGDLNVLIAGNEIDGDVNIDGGTLILVDNDVGGDLNVGSNTVIVQAADNDVDGVYTGVEEQVKAEQVDINILGKVYSFYLEEGENFLFILTKEKEGETYVAD